MWTFSATSSGLPALPRRSNAHGGASEPAREGGQARRRAPAHLAAQPARPAERPARRAERLARPAPEVEAVDMAHDQPVAELEAGVDAVEHLAPGGAERVARIPVRLATRGVGGDAARLDLQVAAARAQHAPHQAGVGAVQVEHLVAEVHLRVVAGGHRGPVAAGEGRVEALDQQGIRVHRLALPGAAAVATIATAHAVAPVMPTSRPRGSTSTPGFMMPCGSSTCFAPAKAARHSAGTSAS